MPATSLAEIVARTGLWPDNTVPYSQSGAASPTRHRPDCSGAASMAMGLPTPGENTVTLVTEGHVRRIGWAELRPGDLVMLGGLNTAGNDGHVGVVVAVNWTQGRYVLWEQSGGLGPDRNTYRLGSASRSGMVPYRSIYIEEDDMPMYGRTVANATVWAGNGVRCRQVKTEAGIVGGFAAVQTFADDAALFDRLGQPDGAVVNVDVQAMAPLVAVELAKLLPKPPTADQIADEIGASIQD